MFGISRNSAFAHIGVIAFVTLSEKTCILGIKASNYIFTEAGFAISPDTEKKVSKICKIVNTCLIGLLLLVNVIALSKVLGLGEKFYSRNDNAAFNRDIELIIKNTEQLIKDNIACGDFAAADRHRQSLEKTKLLLIPG